MSNDRKSSVSFHRMDIDKVLQLYSIYEAEWEHRDDIMWKVSFKLFNLSLIVSVIPYIQEYFKAYIPMNPIIFPIVGFFIGIYFLLVTLSYAARLNAISNSLYKLNLMFPKRVRRTPVIESAITKQKFLHLGKFIKIISKQYIALWTPLVMELFLIVIQVVAIVFLKR